jgi:hypothetical protein
METEDGSFLSRNVVAVGFRIQYSFWTTADLWPKCL